MHLASPLAFSPFTLQSQLAAMTVGNRGLSMGDYSTNQSSFKSTGTSAKYTMRTSPILPNSFSDSTSHRSDIDPFPFMMAGTGAQSKLSLSPPAFSSSFSSPSESERGCDRDDVITSNARSLSTLTQHYGTSISPSHQHSHQISHEEVFARKVFVGGLPIDVSEEEIWQTFHVFGKVLVDWPRRPDGTSSRDDECTGGKTARSMTGYVFLVFEEERSVQKLVCECHKEGERYYLFVSSPTMRNKPVQVRPWRLSDMDYMLDPKMPLDPRRTVFIGGVPRPTRASELADCLNRMYGPVCYVGIDIDPELKYPKGAARVTFTTTQAFIAAITGRFVHVHHADNQKRVEIKPYVMDEQMCDECQGRKCLARYAPYFCGDVGCLQYYCEACWDRVHVRGGKRFEHRPLVRMGDQTKMLPRPPHHNGHSRGGARHSFSRHYSPAY